MKVLTVIGARPQFIKAATVSRVISSLENVQEVIVHTGQHYDENMSNIFFEQLSIPKPNYNLGIGGGPHGQMTGRQLESIERVLLDEKPDWVLVYGDTNSTLAAALAAVKLHIPIAHVEAGLRSFNRKMPEEINRILTDHASELLFAPTESAVKNLQNEGLNSKKVDLVGDVMYDAALFYAEMAMRPVWFDALGLDKGQYVLATIHRAENTDDPVRMKDILKGFEDSAMPLILPLHPRTRERIEKHNLRIPNNVRVQDPVGYLEMVWLEINARLIATDSGGVQKEAYFHGKPCVTLREETEWVELIEEGVNFLVASDSLKITEKILNPAKLPVSRLLYGEGNAAEKIVTRLLA